MLAYSLPGVALLQGVRVEGGPGASASSVTGVQQPLPGPRAGDPATGNGRGRLRPVWGVGEAPPDPVSPMSADAGVLRVPLNG